MPKVRPDILRWARETAHMSISEASKRLKLKALKDASSEDRLMMLENGDNEPSRSLLLEMAKIYRRSLLTFYLSTPPRIADRGKDFRSLSAGHSEMADVLLDALIRDVHARQSLIRSVLEDDEEIKPLSFVGSVNISFNPQQVVTMIRETLNISLVEYRAQTTIENAFKYLRNHTEAVGVFVLLLGNLGSYHTNIELETFRGYALADEIAPFIVINEHDSHSAFSFTLLHELTHIWLGLTGISGSNIDQNIEKFCNEVTSEFLLPKNELIELDVNRSTRLEIAQKRISEFAQDRKISNSMVAYKLFIAGYIDKKQWNDLNTVYRTLWLEHKLKQRLIAEKSESGPNYYVVRQYHIGPNLINLVSRLMESGFLTTSKAGKVLGVKAKNVQRLIDTVHSSASLIQT